MLKQERRSNHVRPCVLLCAQAVLALAACGGGSGNETPAPAGPVSVTCTPASIAPGATSQCSTTVQGQMSSPSVTWSASAGTITSGGLFTAPSSVGNVSITATSTQEKSASGSATIAVQFQVPKSAHVVMVMEENQSYSSVVGNTAVWPHFNELINSGGLPTSYFADAHPSIPDYFMLTTGQMLTMDDGSTVIWNVDNIARRMLAANVTFKIYAEGITQGYLGGNEGNYLIRHNPFAMLSDVAGNPEVANRVICPFTQFGIDVANNALPDFSYIVPDVNDDAHNGTPQQADTWLQSNVVGPLSGLDAFQAGGDGILIVDFDESLDTDVEHGGGHIAPVLWGPPVKSGFTQTSTTIYQHESMLRTVMEALNLSDPPGAAATASDMAGFFVQK